jgi:hypothetical protein
MTLEQIKSEIRSLNPIDRMELCRWLDYETTTDSSSGIGADRSREIRRTIHQTVKTNALTSLGENGRATSASLHVPKNLHPPGKVA